jgi:fructose-1,6-bisphosphatase-3
LTLIFYPAEVVGRLERTLRTPQQQKDYALRMLHELFAVVRLLAARHSLKHVTRIFPSEYRELFCRDFTRAGDWARSGLR